MKQGTAINRIVMLAIGLALLFYFGGAAWHAFHDPYPTTRAYAYGADDTVEATGWLCRTEEVITGSGGVVRVLPGEGEKVAAGATVARLYADREGVERSEQLEALRTEIAQMEAALEAAGSPAQNEGAQAGTVDALVALRVAVAGGDFTRLERHTADFKGAVYQQALRYGSAGDLNAALASARQQAQELEAQAAHDTGRVRVAHSGIFSGQADGYEEVLTPESLAALTPSALDALSPRAVGGDVIGKLVTDSKWYFICPLTEGDASRLVEGSAITARFSRDWSGEVKMTVERIGATENGRRTVTLSSNRFLSQVTLLRRQTVELIFSTMSGIRVPTGAVRVEEGQSVVYVQVGVLAERKPVRILAQGEDYYLVEPVVEEAASQAQERKALRAGDPVIIANQEIWDGKVVE